MDHAAADIVFTGGRVFSAGDTTSRVASVAVRNRAIAFIGDQAEAEAMIAPDTTVIDATGKLLIPGFQDAHAHPIAGGMELLQCDLTAATDATDCLRLIGEYAAANAEQEWILGGGWSMEFFPGGTPTRADLDSVVSDRPVYLINRDHHGAWANSLALELAGIDAGTPDPADGRIERDSDGTPTGTLHEGASHLVDDVKPKPSADFVYQGLLRAQDAFLAAGVTAWQDAAVGKVFGLPDLADTYVRAAQEGALRARVSLALWWERDGGLDQLAGLTERAARISAGVPSERVNVHTVKMMVDGVVENFTAAISEPYLDHHGHPTENRGMSFLGSETLAEYVTAVDAAGLDVHFHALGDRAVHEALNAIERSRSTNRRSDARHHLAHLQLVARDDVPRFPALDASANLQMLWAHGEAQVMDLAVPFLAPDIARRHYPFGDLANAGTRLVAGSDWPVSTLQPMKAIHVAVNRTIPGGNPVPLMGDEQKLTLAAALTAYTAGSAYVNRREDSTGELKVGYRADLALLDRDVFGGPPEEIGDAQVEGTWIDGERVFTR